MSETVHKFLRSLVTYAPSASTDTETAALQSQEVTDIIARYSSPG